MATKKYKVSIHSAEIVDLFDKLPKGMRTPVIESALIMYMKSNSGKALLGHFPPLIDAGNTKETTKGISTKRKTEEKLPKMQIQKSKNVEGKGFIKNFKGGFQ